MRNAALACFLILVPCSLCAQDKKADWKALYGLRSGEKIELVETGMKKHVGTFSTVTDETIQMREGSNDIGIPKENVARVTVLDKSHRFRNAFIFGAVGAGAGAGIGAAVPSHPTIYRAELAEKAPTCFFMLVSTSSTFSPERRPYSAFQSLFLSWACSEHGTRIRKQTNTALRIWKPLSRIHIPS